MRSKYVPAVDRTASVPALLVGLGVGIAAVVLGEVVVFPALDVRSVSDPTFVVGSVSSLPFLVGIVYGGYWLGQSELSTDRYRRVVTWTAACAAGFFLMNLALVLSFPAGSVAEAFSWLRWAITIGACVGLGIGVVEARAIEHAILAERARVRSEEVARQRDTLDYLNSVLRHEILNATTTIDGYVSRVLAEQSDLDPECEQWLEIAVDESEAMATVIDDVRVLLHRTVDEDTLEPTDLAEVLETEVGTLTNVWEAVEVETSIPEDVSVLADDTLPRVFGNLLSNAVEHNDVREPHVAVEVEQTADAVRVDVADNGPGIPDDELATLWERDRSGGDSHGLGLYLVHELVESFDGSVELAETGPTGSRFTIELPRADAEDAGRRPEPAAAA